MNRTGEGSRPCTSPYHARHFADKHSACTINQRRQPSTSLQLVSTTQQVVDITGLTSRSHSPTKGLR